MGLNTNLTDKLPSATSITELEIITASDLTNAATAGVLTVGAGENLHILVKANVTSEVNYVIGVGATLVISGPGIITYVGSSTFLSGDDIALCLIDNMTLISAFGTVLTEITGNNNTDVFFVSSASFGFIPGTISRSNFSTVGPRVTLNFYQSLNPQATWNLTNCSSILAVSPAFFPFGVLSDGMITILNDTPSTHSIIGGRGTFFGGDTLLNLDAGMDDGAVISVSNATITGDVFNTSGTDGTFTAVADAAISSTSIASVEDDGSGAAKFMYTGSDVFVGQEVVITGYITNTDYNGTFFVTAEIAGSFTLNSVAFGTSEASGSFTSDSVTLTDTATTLVDGDSISVDTDLGTEYDGGSVVYNQLTNTFQINRAFVETHTGSWSTRGLDQTDKKIKASASSGTPNSTSKAQMSTTGNALVTTVPTGGTNAKIMVNASTWVLTTNERIKDLGNGVAVYVGLDDTTVALDGNVLIEPSSSTKNISSEFAMHGETRNIVTFDNTTNTILETATPRVDGDIVTFNETEGTLPAELRTDILYFVVSQTTNAFALSYTSGGSAIAFTDDGTPTNSYAVATVGGSQPREPIAANNPRTLVPQGLQNVTNGDRIFLTVTNQDDVVNLEVIDLYFRIVTST